MNLYIPTDFSLNSEHIISEILLVLHSHIRDNRKALLQINNGLAEHGIHYGTLNEILVNNEKIEDLNEIELCLLAVAVSEAIDDDRIYSHKKFFNSNEIKKAKSYYRKDLNKELILPYIFSGVLRGSDVMYTTFLSAGQLKLLWESGVITYNIEVQRLPKEVRRKDGTIYFEPDVKPASVRSISELMRSGRYRSNSLILNILMDGNDRIDYSDGKLTVYEGTTINIIDGAHRLEAAVKTIEYNPAHDEMLPILIYHLPVQIAQETLSQINTFNPFDKTLVRYYGDQKQSEQIVKELMGIPELAERIRIKTAIPKNSNYLTNFAVLSDAIDNAFNPKNTKDRFEVTAILKKFFGYLISAFSKEFIDEFVQTKETSWINHHNTFYGYVFLAKSLIEHYGVDYPVNKIEEAIHKINFCKQDGLPYNDMISLQGKVNSDTIKKNIGEFFMGVEI